MFQLSFSRVNFSCALDVVSMALWCDQTNFTVLPNPDEIRSYAPSSKAVYLYMNISCLSQIDVGKRVCSKKCFIYVYSDDYFNCYTTQE